jgi:Beta-lactamase superfamily domain
MFNATAGLRKERTRASKQFRDGQFRNTSGVSPNLTKPPIGVMVEYFTKRGERVPKRVLPLAKPFDTWRTEASTGFRATWLGHSTVLLEMDGKRVLTDPVFGDRASPFSFAGPKRFHPVPATLLQLPKLDAVVLSHDHYDHLCKSSIQTLAGMDVPIVTSLGVGKLLEAYGVRPERITELDWNESAEVSGIRLTATPSQHFSGRRIDLQNKTLWSSFVIQSETLASPRSFATLARRMVPSTS